MKTVGLTRTFALGFLISLLSLSTTIDVYAQPPIIAEPKTPTSLIDQLLATDNNRGRRHFPRARLARAIAQDESISPKNRVDVLTTILRRELENPCPITGFIHGGYGTPTSYIQRQYVFGLEDVGAKAIPHLRKHLDKVKVAVQNISPSLGNTDSVDVAEMQHTLCALGLPGDKESFTEVLKILKDEDGDGYMRQMAAMALGRIKNKVAIPTLKRALKDDFRVDYPKFQFTNSVYPVRSGAYKALKAFGFKFKLINDRSQWDYRIVEEP